MASRRRERSPKDRPGDLDEEDVRGSKRGSAFKERAKERKRFLVAGAKGFPGADKAPKSGDVQPGSEAPRKSQKGEDGGPVRLGSLDAPFTSNAETVAEVPWLSSGLRVRFIDEDGPFKSSYLKKGFVRKVDDAALVADVDVDGGTALRKVPQNVLETVVSKGCLRVEVVRGPHRGIIAELLERDAKRNIAVIRTTSTQMKGIAGDSRMELSLDDVCEFKQ
mmetsp:Transcript_153206/g.491314  ORF Transcript_153206/g.491314 Transcript_153206/m.491314 type:complete len:221 (+) Transcript_153206:44-706(+)